MLPVAISRHIKGAALSQGANHFGAIISPHYYSSIYPTRNPGQQSTWKEAKEQAQTIIKYLCSVDLDQLSKLVEESRMVEDSVAREHVILLIRT